MGEIIDLVKGSIDPQNIGGIRDGDGDCGHIDPIEIPNENKSPV
jgi:hypothetical protein